MVENSIIKLRERQTPNPQYSKDNHCQYLMYISPYTCGEKTGCTPLARQGSLACEGWKDREEVEVK